ncbi:MAG: DUF4811 domain-containing protein [Candidatus Paralactobacillus gallistercoris]|uniref:DUF4811 domain-containing protein n=1 Tax=Candidatus Paralactobacillus gallistercoris TaxID=2838724 RepID=A0A948X2J3_9LACO|nr:DUF4811 domain-containing protein [Candidatus Paralactobacillus gallistercoris]
MALWILAISAVLFLVAFIGIKKPVLQYSISGILLAISIIMSCFLMTNDNNHLGMKLVSQTSTEQIASVSGNKQLNLLLYKQLGNGNERIYIYRHRNGKKTLTTPANVNTTNKVVQNNNIKQPELVTNVKHYTYKNDFWRVMFSGLSLDKEVAERTNTFKVPSNWLVLSTDQLKQLKAQMPVLKQQVQQEVQKQLPGLVKSQMATQLKQHPHMNKQQVAQLEKQITQQQAQALAQKLMQNAIQQTLK